MRIFVVYGISLPKFQLKPSFELLSQILFRKNEILKGQLSVMKIEFGLLWTSRGYERWYNSKIQMQSQLKFVTTLILGVKMSWNCWFITMVSIFSIFINMANHMEVIFCVHKNFGILKHASSPSAVIWNLKWLLKRKNGFLFPLYDTNLLTSNIKNYNWYQKCQQQQININI